MKRIRPYWIFPAAGLSGKDYYWMLTLKRSLKPLPAGFKWWTWQWVRPDHAWLSMRGMVCFQDDWLPPGTQKVAFEEFIKEGYEDSLWEEGFGFDEEDSSNGF